MQHPGKIIRVTVSLVVSPLLLVVSDLSITILPAHSNEDALAPTTLASIPTPLFRDDFDDDTLDLIQETIPAIPLEIRLNAGSGETFYLDYVRVYAIEEREILVDDFAPQPRQGDIFWPHNRLEGRLHHDERSYL